MVERSDRGNGAEQRLPQGVDLAALPMRGEIAREYFSVVDQRLIGGEQQDIRGSAYLVLRVLETKTRLQRDQAREVFALFSNDGACFHEDAVAVMARERGAKAPRNLQRAFDIV